MKKVRQFILAIGIIFLSTHIIAQPSFEWAKRNGGNTSVSGQTTALDDDGNLYVAGTFTGTVDFDPGPGVFNLTATASDSYIQKLDSDGNFIWAKAFHGTGTNYVRAYSIDIDTNYNLCVTGLFQGTVDFDPGVGTNNLTAIGAFASYILKLDSAGNFIWANALTSTHITWGSGIKVDKENNIYACGYFNNTMDVDPGSGVFNLTSSGAYDSYVVKVKSNGDLIWAHNFGSTSGDQAYSIELDDKANVFIGGNYRGTVDFDPGPSVFNMTTVNTGAGYVHKLDSAGNFVWAKSFETTNRTEFKSLNYDKSDKSIIIGGAFLDDMDADPGPGSYPLTVAGSDQDILIEKLDSNGNFVWAKSMGWVAPDIAHATTIDRLGNIYATGEYEGTVDFDPGSGTFNLTAQGITDIFIVKLQPTGDFSWAVSFGSTTNPDAGAGISVDDAGNIYSTGNFLGTADFDPGAGSFTLNSMSNTTGAYIQKLGTCLPHSTSFNASACGSYTSPSGNHTWTTSNTYMDTVMNVGGCDSILTINLTITGPSNSTDILVECDSVLWIDGNTYYSNNTTATYTIVNGASSGCDSIITLNLTMNNTANGTDVQTACNSYTWIDNNTYTTNNTTATHTLVNGAATGCDSIVTLNLTINNADTSVTKASPMLTANATGATYRWLDCNNAYAIIAGATNQNFTPAVNGSYAVEVTENGCIDTSSCYTIIGIGIGENNLSNSVSLYPNPTTGVINIALGNLYKNINIQVKDVTGKLIDQKNYQGTDRIEYNLKGESGIYFMELITKEGERTTLKLIKQ